MQLVADKQWFRSKDTLHLLAGSPLTAFTVTQAGAHVLDAIESGSKLPSGHEPLTKRLLATGAVHPISPPPASAQEVTVVIPAFVQNKHDAEQLQNLVTSLRGLQIVVVDDCSPHEFSLAGARLVSNLENTGPGPSRNSGLEEVTTPVVAFIDMDTSVSTDQVLQLAGFLTDESVSVVAPRVATKNQKTFLSDYESRYSPLDLGPEPAIVRPLSRVSYVPTAVLVARADTIRALNAFDQSLRWGEDVDLIWRASQHGHRCVYAPSVVVEHAPRKSIRALLAQRFHYGSSAAHLDERHPYTAAPLRAHLLMLIPALLLLAGNLYSFLLITPISMLYFLVTLRSTGLSIQQRLRVMGIGFQSTLALTARSIARAWWPIFAIGGYFSVLLGAMLIFSVFVPTIFGIVKSKSTYPLQYLVVRPLENFSYGLGVWHGAIKAKNIRCLLPVITLRKSASSKRPN